MLTEMLKSWKGKVEVDGTVYSDIQSVPFSSLNGQLHIKLYPIREKSKISVSERETEYRITVKKYMTEHATPEFDFMAQWNNDNPMPLRTMTGIKVKETKGMVYMKLHGQAEEIVTCMRCNKQLTNPISRLYGIGPECIKHIPILMDINVNDVDAMKQRLVDVTWEGWIIKSAITDTEVIE